MSRRRRGRPISGWLALDKPPGRSSTQALAEVKRLFDAEKAGHAGTLDPLASGCLPIAFGDATKTVLYMMDGRKLYSFSLRWGEETDTDDGEGSVVARSDHRPSAAEINAMLPEFTGTIMQVPPAFSAIKLDGERAYDLARGGEEPQLQARPVEIHRLALVSIVDADHALFEAECGKGTYVRSLARDLGRKLGTRAHIFSLRRLSVGPFGEADLVSIETIRAAHEEGGSQALDRFLRPVEFALASLPELNVGGGDRQRLLSGQAILLRGRDAPHLAGPAFATASGRLVAIGDIAAGEFSPKRVFSQH